MTPEEVNQLKSIVMTLADPRGNWPFGWEALCKLAELDPAQYRAHFERHPILPDDEMGAGPPR